MPVQIRVGPQATSLVPHILAVIYAGAIMVQATDKPAQFVVYAVFLPEGKVFFKEILLIVIPE